MRDLYAQNGLWPNGARPGRSVQTSCEAAAAAGRFLSRLRITLEGAGKVARGKGRASVARDSIRSRDCFEHNRGMFGGNAQQHARRAAGLPPALLPILQGGRTDAQQPGEFRLAQLELGPDHDDGVGFDAIDSRDDTLVAAEVGARIADALEQFLELVFFMGIRL